MWIEVRTKETARDVRKEGLQQAIREDLGLKAELFETSDVYVIDGSYSTREAELVGKAMSDRIVQDFSINSQLYSKGAWVVVVRYKPQITDPVEQSVLKLVEDLGLAAHSATMMQKYVIRNASENDVKVICEGLLANENTQQYGYGFETVNVKAFLTTQATTTVMEKEELVNTVKITKASNKELRKISERNTLSLSVEEMRATQAHFRKLRREPTDVELETLAQTWSEHCKHKTFNSEIELDIYGSSGKRKRTEKISNLFKETIVAATEEIAKDKNGSWKDNLVSVFKDNAGIIKFDGENCLAFKVETHNHPSALDPYGGAGTGIGGVIRDVLGAGLGAKPIFSTDVFCFANPDYKEKLPKGVLHPKRIFKGVVGGVRDYGNRMGIPTINGSITFHDSYLAPLVYCGTAGIMPDWAAHKKPKQGDLIVVVGGKTGKDGLHGATFSSTELKEGTATSVVQIGNAIEEKKMLDAVLEARDKRLYSAITDCGAGGFSSAVGEMGKELGAEVELANVPLKRKGMKPWEIWLSESQERMVLSVPEKNLQKLRGICEKEGAGIAVIGKFTTTKKLVVKNNGKTVAELAMDFLHNGLPKPKRKAVYRERKAKAMRQRLQQRKNSSNYNEILKKLLGMPSIASKEWVIRQYDHEVQANTIVKPLTGSYNDGPSDASVVRPVFSSRKCVAVANGINPRYGIISPYWMAAAAIDEALRNIVATGGSVSKTAVLDNFCLANTDGEEKLGTLVIAAKACRDFAVAYGTPFISGKDSLHNEVVAGNKRIPILDTLLISAIAVIDDIDNIITMDIKKEGSSLYVIGETKDEMGGSHYNELIGLGLESGNVPTIDAEKSKKIFSAAEEAIKRKTVLACHDCSEGGMAVTIAEMCFAGGIGADVELRNVPHTKPFFEKGLSKNGDEIVLFSESQTRFVAEVEKGKEAEFESVMRKNGCSFGFIGKTKGKLLIIRGSGGKLIDSDINELKNAWQRPLRW